MTEVEQIEGLSFVDVDDVPTIQRQGRAKKSEPLIQKFMESGKRAVALQGVTAKPQSVKASLQRYVTSRQLPVEVVTRGDTVYLKRTDTNGDASE